MRPVSVRSIANVPPGATVPLALTAVGLLESSSTEMTTVEPAAPLPVTWMVLPAVVEEALSATPVGVYPSQGPPGTELLVEEELVVVVAGGGSGHAAAITVMDATSANCTVRFKIPGFTSLPHGVAAPPTRRSGGCIGSVWASADPVSSIRLPCGRKS